jgi:hypothetical protein
MRDFTGRKEQCEFEWVVVALEVFMGREARKMHFVWSGYGPEPAVKRVAEVIYDKHLLVKVNNPDFSRIAKRHAGKHAAMQPELQPPVERAPLTFKTQVEAYEERDDRLLDDRATPPEVKNAVRLRIVKEFLALAPAQTELDAAVISEALSAKSKPWQELPLSEDERKALAEEAELAKEDADEEGQAG